MEIISTIERLFKKVTLESFLTQSIRVAKNKLQSRNGMDQRR